MHQYIRPMMCLLVFAAAGCAASYMGPVTELAGPPAPRHANEQLIDEKTYIICYGDAALTPQERAQAMYWYQRGEHAETIGNPRPIQFSSGFFP